MNVYIDTSFFIDYFSSKSIFTKTLRIQKRKDRNVDQIQADANIILNKLNNHRAMTSICTIQEYAELQNEITNNILSSAINKKIASRSIMRFESSKLMNLCKQKKILIIDCNEKIINDTFLKTQYSHLGFFDAIHVHTAVLNKADILITGDDELIKNSCKFRKLIIMDSDQALQIL